MATLSEIRAQQQSAGTLVSGKRGTTNRSLGATPVAPTTPVKPQGNAFVDKVTSVGKQTLDIGATLAKKTGGFVVNTGKDIVRQAEGAFYGLNPQIAQTKQRVLSDATKQLDAKQAQVVSAYKSGKMSKENFTKAMQGFSGAYGDLSKESIKLQQETDPQKLASDLAWTAVNVLSGSSAGLVKSGGKQVVQTGLDALITKSVSGIEKAITKVPAARQLMERNAQQVVTREAQKLAGESMEQYLARQGKQVAVGLLIKRPIFYQTNVGLAEDTYNHILDGQYDDATKSAAWLGAQMVGGGPVGWVLGKGKKGFSKLGELSYGKNSFIDGVSSRIGNGNPNQIARFLETARSKAPKEFEEANKTFRILQETNLRSANENTLQAVDNVLSHYTQNGIDLANITPSQLYKDMNNWAKADEIAQRTLRSGLVSGITPEQAGNYVVVRWDSQAKNALAKAVSESDGTLAGMAQVVKEFADRPGVGWTNNDILMSRIEQAINFSASPKSAADNIRKISTASTALKGMPSKVTKELADLGFTVAAPFGGRKTPLVDASDTRKLITAAVKGDTAIYDVARAPQPVLAAISGALTKSGLSPKAANEVAMTKLSESLIASLDELKLGPSLGLRDSQGGNIANGGKAVLSELQKYVETKKGAFLLNKVSSGRSAVIDIRQLTNDEIATALNISKTEAGQVSRAVRNAYTKVPLELRGLGDKIIDYSIAAPLSPMRYYQRVQSALRYTYNPFFRFQERFETATLAKMNANKFLWLKPKAELNMAVKELEDAGIFRGTVSGPGAEDQIIGRISANLTQAQKRNLAGLATTVAERQGKTLQTVLRENPEQIDDALRIIVQYPRTGVISSPLARTLNVAFFPMRYNAKVSYMAAKKLAEQPPSVQYATIQGLMKMKDWLGSDEGIRWRSEHADAIQVFSWASPLGNIAQLYTILSGNVHSPGDFGLLGGLPFGVISQILDGQGIINLNTPYVNPKTGDVYPDNIPASTKARAATALNDLIGTMFSFPGRTLGLPGKDATLRKAIDMFIDTNGKDFDKQLNVDQLTPAQKNMVRVLKGDTSEEALDSLYTSPAPGQFNYYTLPPSTIPTRPLAPKTPAVERRTGLPSKASQKKTKEKKQKPLPTPIPSR